MNLKLGDKVRFVNENLEGFITSVKDKTTVGVTIEDDFEIPVLASELVKIEFTDQKKAEDTDSKEIKPKQTTNPLGVYLAYDRRSENVMDIKIHNNLSDKVLMVCYEKDKDVFRLKKQAQIDRNDTLDLGSLDLEKFEKWPHMLFQFIFIDNISIKPSEPKTLTFRTNAKEFHQNLKFCFFLQKQAYMYRLDESLSKIDFEQLKQKDFNEQPEKPLDLNAKPDSVVDLHYEKLAAKGLYAEDRTALQMEVFTKSLEAAYTNRMEGIVFIHGVGNQYLKNKIRTYLVKHKDIVNHFEDADMLKFGGGATYVSLK